MFRAMDSTVCVSVPEWVKKVFECRGIDVSEFVRRVLVEEAEKLYEEDLKRGISDVVKRLESKIDFDEWAKTIDELRKCGC